MEYLDNNIFIIDSMNCIYIGKDEYLVQTVFLEIILLRIWRLCVSCVGVWCVCNRGTHYFRF